MIYGYCEFVLGNVQLFLYCIEDVQVWLMVDYMVDVVQGQFMGCEYFVGDLYQGLVGMFEYWLVVYEEFVFVFVQDIFVEEGW